MENSYTFNKIYPVNVAFIGESGVGKTSIINRLQGKKFEQNTIATVQPYVSTFKFSNEENIPNSEIKINLWDTMGQERFRSLCANPIKRADIIIFVRDDRDENFEGEKGWIKFVKNLVDLELKIVIYCLNKTDLISEEKKEIIYEKFGNEASKINAFPQFISSKTSDGFYNLKSLIKKKALDLVLEEIKCHNYEISIFFVGISGAGKPV